MDTYKSTIKNLWNDKKTRALFIIVALLFLIAIILIIVTANMNRSDDSAESRGGPGFSLVDHGLFYRAGFAQSAVNDMTEYILNYFEKNYPKIANADFDEETYVVTKKNNYEEYVVDLNAFDINSVFVADFRLTIHAYSYKNLDYSIEKIPETTE